MSSDENNVIETFNKRYEGSPLIVRSPGRINLIGEHVDYNDGFVMPAAIDKEIVFAISFSSSGQSEVYSVKYGNAIRIDHENPQKVKEPLWANYLLGVLRQFTDKGFKTRAFNCVFGGDIPMGAGMSSSAAMECGFGFAINELHQFGVPKVELVKMAQWAEHNYVGVKCGIMDQFASMMSKEDHAILLDCRSLDFEYAPLDLKEYTIVLCDTKVKHSLVDSEYNTRRNECEKGVEILQSYDKGIRSLRDVSLKALAAHRSEFPGKVYNRCFYVVDEIRRVQEAAKDLKNIDLKAFGRKMFETHEGLSSLYEVSCKELDFLVAEAKKYPQVLGSRMMGGGFGGCTINIVSHEFVDEFEQQMRTAYQKAFKIEMPVYRAKIKGGTSVASPQQT